MIKKFKIITLFILICFINLSCGSVKKAFDPGRKNSSDEFLVEKKSPLSVPPNLDELPLPKEKVLDETVIKDDLEALINNNENTKVQEIDPDVERFIIDQIKNNQ